MKKLSNFLEFVPKHKHNMPNIYFYISRGFMNAVRLRDLTN